MADSLIKALLVKDLKIPVFIEKEFNVRCCIRGYHIYQTQWNAEIGARLTTAPETWPGVLVEDKYAIAVMNNGKTNEHVPKFLTKLKFFFLKTAGKLHITVTGPRRYSVDLKQGGLELPADFFFLFVKRKKVSSKARKDIGRGAEVWETNERSRAKKKKRKRKRN